MVSRNRIPDDDWKDWYYSEYVVELDGIAPSTSTLPVFNDNLYTQVRNAVLKSRSTFIM